MTNKEISEILDSLDKFMAKDAKRHPSWRVRCVVCTSPIRRDLTRDLLMKVRNTVDIARQLNVIAASVRHHMIYCLPKRAGAVFHDIDGHAEHQKRGFPLQGTLATQKSWLLKELLFARAEVLKKSKNGGKLDTRQLVRLAKDISKLSDELAKARVAAREEKGKKKDDSEDEFTPEQIAEMNLVNLGKTMEVPSGGSETSRPNGKAE